MNRLGHSILIVDDDPDSRAMLTRILKGCGFSICQSENGECAIRLLDYQNVDLIISDIQMPNGDGFWLLNQIRRSGNQTPVILISGGVPLTAEKAQSVGANGFLQKPFKPIDLSSLISHVLLEKREYA